eukprot:13508268-Alexandrium_andersonii.AAC.1
MSWIVFALRTPKHGVPLPGTSSTSPGTRPRPCSAPSTHQKTPATQGRRAFHRRGLCRAGKAPVSYTHLRAHETSAHP